MTNGEEILPTDELELHHFWPTLLRAAETEPQDIDHLRGASGIDHAFVAVGADEGRRRLVVISSESSASAAAMAHVDIQTAMPEIRVIVARPVVFDLAAVGRSIAATTGQPTLTIEDLSPPDDAQLDGDEAQEMLNQKVATMLAPLAEQIQRGRAVGHINLLQGLGQLLQQITKAEWRAPGDDPRQPIVDFTSLLASAVEHADSELGVCPIPLHAFSNDELEIIHGGSDVDGIAAILRRHDILQYFFPARDQTALGLIDRGQHALTDLAATVATGPELGHPYGEGELVADIADVPTLVDELQSRKLIVEGEVGYELTEEGRAQRATVRFKPREGLVSKLLNRVSLKVNLKSIFRID